MRFAAHPHEAAVAAHGVVDNGEAEARTLGTAAQFALHAVKLAEDAALFPSRDADAVVGHADLDVAAVALGPDLDALGLARILDGVGEQVLNRLFGRAFIGQHAGQRRGNVGLHQEMALRELRLHAREHARGNLAEVGWFHAVGAQPGFHAREVEDVLDQAGQLLGLAVDDAVVLLRPFRRSHPAQLERLGEQLD